VPRTLRQDHDDDGPELDHDHDGREHAHDDRDVPDSHDDGATRITVSLPESGADASRRRCAAARDA
jgi:hypothetical protein